jgi:hypothetical protein
MLAIKCNSVDTHNFVSHFISWHVNINSLLYSGTHFTVICNNSPWQAPLRGTNANSMEHNLSYKANNRLDVQYFLRDLRNPMVHCHVQNSPLIDAESNRLPVTHYYGMHFNIIPHLCQCLLKYYFHVRNSSQIVVCIL